MTKVNDSMIQEDEFMEQLKSKVNAVYQERNRLRERLEQIRINAYRFTPELALPEIKRILEEERNNE